MIDGSIKSANEITPIEYISIPLKSTPLVASFVALMSIGANRFRTINTTPCTQNFLMNAHIHVKNNAGHEKSFFFIASKPRTGCLYTLYSFIIFYPFMFTMSLIM